MDKIVSLVPPDGNGLLAGKALRPVLTRAEVPLPALKQVRAAPAYAGKTRNRG